MSSTYKESDVSLLNQLFEIARRPEFQVRFKWDKGNNGYLG
ncbi:hypothetical protein O9992_17485 [Vibrio lentus]|nr:hypothetical protein [Vibrio lentus]